MTKHIQDQYQNKLIELVLEQGFVLRSQAAKFLYPEKSLKRGMELVSKMESDLGNGRNGIYQLRYPHVIDLIEIGRNPVTKMKEKLYKLVAQ